MSDDRGFQNYIEPLASVLNAPDADYSKAGAAGFLLSQLTGKSGDAPLAQNVPTDWNTADAPPLKRSTFGNQRTWASDLPGIYGGAYAPNPTINPATGLQQFNLKDAQMSGAQGPMPPPMQGAPQGGPPMAGGPPQGQIPPQVLQMLQQRMAQQGGMPGGGGPMPGGPPGGAPMAGGPGGPPGGPMPPQGGAAPMGQPGQPGAGGGQHPMTPQQMAQQGRFGDSVVAHLTPGEIEVPPQVQTPQLMHMLQQAFAKAGVSPQQFTAGSPQSSHNPATGAPEYSLLAALLPILGGVGGSLIGGPAGGAIGGALGGGIGGMADKGGTANVLASAAGGGLGGWLGGGGLSSGAAEGAGATASTSPFSATGAAGNAPFGNGLSAMANPELNTSAAASLAPSQAMAGAANAGSPSYLSMLKPGLGAGLGASVGSMVAPPQMPGGGSGLPPGFGNSLPPLNPNFNQLLGNGQSSRVSGNGYNPYAAATGQPFNFYSPNGNGT